MKFLIDQNPKRVQQLVADYPDFVCGQLITPNHSRSNWGSVFALDNNAFVDFRPEAFRRLQERNFQHNENCLFVSCPDVVGSGRRTLELFKMRRLFSAGFDLSLVIQNGMEDLEIPWNETPAIFIGGKDPWKDSESCLDIVRTAKILQKHVHVGRVNNDVRYRRFAALGCDTCDGSGVAQYGHMIEKLIAKVKGHYEQPKLFDTADC